MCVAQLSFLQKQQGPYLDLFSLHEDLIYFLLSTLVKPTKKISRLFHQSSNKRNISATLKEWFISVSARLYVRSDVAQLFPMLKG